MPRPCFLATKSSGLLRCLALLGWLGVLGMCGSVLAHHGGLGVEGDLVQWALKVDQWQDEVMDQGYRIKFLAYPRQPVLGNRTRLVFEIQAAASGRYVGGLTAELRMQAPDGSQRSLPLSEIAGVVAYYEAAVVFDQPGEHVLTFRATVAEGPFAGSFRRTVGRSAWFGDWATVTGNVAVLAAGTVTWLALVLSVQRRFMHPPG